MLQDCLRSFPHRFFVFAFLVIAVVAVPRLSAQTAPRDRQLVQEPAPQPKLSPQRRVALVIGNAAYQNTSRLSNPANDAEDMARALRELGFELIGNGAQVNQNADQMKHLIKMFGEKLTGGGIGLFYYAGHGVQSLGHNYLVPVEVNNLREKTLEFDTVDVNRVLVEMDAASNGFNIVILDACRNNPFSRSWRDASQGLAQVNAPEGTLIAYATSPGRVASDGTGRNGAYTSELLKQMRKPGLTIEEMFKTVRAGVKAASKDQQTPWESSSLVGEFCFAGGCGVSNTSASNSNSTPTSVDQSTFELSYWDSIKNSTNPEDFKAYLDKYPDGQFTALAKNRIGSLTKEAKPSESPETSTSATAIELAFWDSIKNSGDPEDFKSYLQKYPNGQFADLARRRAESKRAAQGPGLPGGTEPTFFRITASVRADNRNNGWTNTGLVVRAGQRLRISASGRVYLGNRNYSSPEGVPGLPDLGKLMRNQPTGALIAVIGDDNDDFIFVGNSRDFIAPRTGVLFLGVNEQNLIDNSGNYDVVIEAEAVGGNPR